MQYLTIWIAAVVIMVSKGLEMFKRARELMVEISIRGKGIRDKNVLDSMRSVPRHLFVPPAYQKYAYDDHPLPIGHGQTVSQPSMVALMAEAAQLKKSDKVLEIGTGCGYAAAVVSTLVKSVYSIETIPELADFATQRLQQLGYDNVRVKTGDGSVGWSQHAPYDSIIVTAKAPEVPTALKGQLAPLGRLVIPVAGTFSDKLVRVTKVSKDKFHEEYLCDVRFVPLIGEQGYPKPAEE